MADFYELVARRQSDRAYDPAQPVDREALERIVDAARLAPSACNSQPWHFIVVDRPDLCAEVAESLTSIGMNKFAAQAPCFIVVVQEAPNFTARLGGWIKNKHFPLIDCGIATAHLTLAAAEEGLGSCIMGWFDERRLKRLLGVPRSRRVLLVVAIGHSLQPLRPKQRHQLAEVMGDNRY